jgi:osmotically-inducible protein OsmY
MKKIMTTFVLFLALSFVAAAKQSSDSTPKKKPTPPPAVDCSNVNDTALATSVKDKLVNTPSLKEYTINVAAKDGMVTLTGVVKNGRNKGLASLQAKRVACVKKVANQITVETAAAKPKTSGQ